MDLPDIYEFHGDWTTYVEELYEIYLETIVNDKTLKFENLPIRTRFKPMTDGKGYGFWHIISDGEEEDERDIDFRRCERLPWVHYCIKNAKQPPAPISWWKNKRGSKTHIVILNEDNGFVIILEERKDYYLLKTAYVARSRRLKDLKKERDKYWGL
ncbi:MAG: oxidoreductase [Epsilonproteobacteria bacterium]|nr:MAG: oxidoreductase [Campylobacterota bacterium]